MHDSKQDFSTDEFDHHFTIDGRSYYLLGIQMADLVVAASLAELADDKDKVEGFRDFMISRVRSDRPRWVLWLTGNSIGRAVRSLNPVQLTRLFQAWSNPGGGSGEASASPVSTSSTDEN